MLILRTDAADIKPSQLPQVRRISASATEGFPSSTRYYPVCSRVSLDPAGGKSLDANKVVLAAGSSWCLARVRSSQELNALLAPGQCTRDQLETDACSGQIPSRGPHRPADLLNTQPSAHSSTRCFSGSGRNGMEGES